MMALNAAVMALLHRERTGEGLHVDVAMAKNVAVLQMLRIAEENETDKCDDYLSGRLASYNVYRCADGKHIALGALEPKFWQKFCNVIGHAEWGGRLMERELVAEVAALFASRPRNFWTEKLENEDVCLSPVLTLQEAAMHPLFQNGFPNPRGSVALNPAPKLGADNHELLL